jgi:hypothetical protein
MDYDFGPEPPLMIGHDILDIVSRKAQAKRQRGGFGDAMIPARLELGMPGQFDLPNVDDVSPSFACLLVLYLE